MKVLIATNSVACSQHVVPTVLKMFSGQSVEATVVGVEEVASGLGRLVPVADVLVQQELEEMRQGLAEAEALLTAGGVTVETVERKGKPGPEIVGVAEALKPDVIVLGAHAIGPVARALLGSVSEHVLHHWAGATLVIR